MKWEYLQMDSRSGVCLDIYHYATADRERPTYKGLIEKSESYVLEALGWLEWELVSVQVLKLAGILETYHYFFKRPIN